ncbi:hypothetical protein BDV12DRAFT_196491 [Aspergillus spectabilis]
MTDRKNETFFHDNINSELANELLSKYRREKLPQFPFVIIPAEADVSTLRKESPFLLLCILTASTERDYALQNSLELFVRKEIASRVVVGVERNMDILQGLLVHAAWYHYHWETYHTHHYMLLQMASMIAADLGLDRQESFRMQQTPPEGKEAVLAKGSVAHTAAQQRALLGCYYLCSKSSLFRRQLYMRHTPWIDQCAGSLAERAGYPTDSKHKTYIDVQSRMRQSRLLFDEERRYLDRPKSATWDQVTKLVAQQQAQTNNLLPSLNTSDDWSLRIELGAAPALVRGQALGRQKHVFTLQEHNQLGYMTASAHCVIDIFLEMPSPAAIHLPSPAYATIWYCLLALSKLSLLFHPNERRSIGVDRKKKIHEKATAIMQKFDELTLGDDFWPSSIGGDWADAGVAGEI